MKSRADTVREGYSPRTWRSGTRRNAVDRCAPERGGVHRWRAIKDQEPDQLHAVIALNPHALADARALDAERKAGKVRGPLHGVPILLKDNIESADGTATTAGSLA
jgi:hypothetical protein